MGNSASIENVVKFSDLYEKEMDLFAQYFPAHISRVQEVQSLLLSCSGCKLRYCLTSVAMKKSSHIRERKWFMSKHSVTMMFSFGNNSALTFIKQKYPRKYFPHTLLLSSSAQDCRVPINGVHHSTIKPIIQ